MRRRHVAAMLCGFALLGGALASGSSADAAPIGWTVQIGGSSYDSIEGLDTTSSGDIVIGGSTGGTMPGGTPAGSDDAYVAKFSKSGTLVWLRQFGTSAVDGVIDLDVTATGDSVVAGNTRGDLGGTNAGSHDVFVRRYDKAGNVKLTAQFGSSSLDVPLDVAVAPSGAIYVSGWTGGNLGGNINHGDSDAFVAKLSRSGVLQWVRLVGTTGEEYGWGVAVGKKEVVYLVGQTGEALDGQTSAGATDAFAAAFDKNGNPLWTQQFGTASDDGAIAATIGREGHLRVVGTFGTGTPGEPHGFVRRISPTGAELWTTRVGKSGNEGLTAACTLPGTAGIVVSGQIGNALTGATNAGGLDAIAIQVNDAGVVTKARQVGTAQNDQPYGVGCRSSTAPGGAVVLGFNTEGVVFGGTSGGSLDAALAAMNLLPVS